MRLIKLHSIDSTNNFLKEMVRDQHVADYTVVTASEQTSGRGQMGAKWQSESCKNLIMSILLPSKSVELSKIFMLNITVALSVIDALALKNIENLKIKWPNDIMADDKKIAGILIENTIKSKEDVSVIAGIGLNVNQMQFDGLPGATSLALHSGCEFDVDQLVNDIYECLKQNIESLTDPNQLLQRYYQHLFKKDVAMNFKSDDQEFIGTIRGIDSIGNLQVEHQNGSLHTYSLKEITMLY